MDGIAHGERCERSDLATTNSDYGCGGGIPEKIATILRLSERSPSEKRWPPEPKVLGSNVQRPENLEWRNFMFAREENETCNDENQTDCLDWQFFSRALNMELSNHERETIS